MPRPLLSRRIPALPPVLARPLVVATPSAYAADPILTTPVQSPHPYPAHDPDPVALDLNTLSTISAGADTHIDVITHQDLIAVNSGNSISADSVGSGSINMTSDAMQGYSGVGNFVMNTGHNNNLQGTISVTVINTADLPRQ